jgi:hypothetical protein
MPQKGRHGLNANIRPVFKCDGTVLDKFPRFEAVPDVCCAGARDVHRRWNRIIRSAISLNLSVGERRRRFLAFRHGRIVTAKAEADYCVSAQRTLGITTKAKKE